MAEKRRLLNVLYINRVVACATADFRMGWMEMMRCDVVRRWEFSLFLLPLQHRARRSVESMLRFPMTSSLHTSLRGTVIWWEGMRTLQKKSWRVGFEYFSSLFSVDLFYCENLVDNLDTFLSQTNELPCSHDSTRSDRPNTTQSCNAYSPYAYSRPHVLLQFGTLDKA